MSSRESILEGLGNHKSWSLVKSHLLKAQEQATPPCHKSRKQGRRQAWMNSELLLELRQKKKKPKVHALGKQNLTSQEEHRAVVHTCREKTTTKAKAQLQLTLAMGQTAKKEVVFFFLSMSTARGQ